MTHEIESFQTIGACVERLTEFKQFKPEAKNETGKEIDSYPLALTFKDVTFSYNGDDSVIKRLSLRPQAWFCSGTAWSHGKRKNHPRTPDLQRCTM
jgi:ABC-type bacteriocin/lantibiotic exporter with double-glycine peptidase domain